METKVISTNTIANKSADVTSDHETTTADIDTSLIKNELIQRIKNKFTKWKVHDKIMHVFFPYLEDANLNFNNINTDTDLTVVHVTNMDKNIHCQKMH